MAVTINQEQRDAIWADVELNHTALSDIEMGFRHGDSDDFCSPAPGIQAVRHRPRDSAVALPMLGARRG